MTQLKQARKNIITPEMKAVAKIEGLPPEFICQGIADGNIVIPANKLRKNLKLCGIGKGLSTKVNANIGTSTDFGTVESEVEKLKMAEMAGADTIMDLSTGPKINSVRQAILGNTCLPLGTVPVYQAAVEAKDRYGAMVKMTADDLFSAIESQAKEGVDFVTVHCGVTQQVIDTFKGQGRLTDIVSRGGTFTAGWMVFHQAENPLYEHFDRLLDICREYDVTLSLGDGLRPGCIADATDRAQVAELLVLGELVKRARDAEVQVMVEGPGHVPLNQIEANIRLQKSVCEDAPFYVLGPLVTDIAPGYDHITGAIGGAVAAAAGADFLCYVTPAEHLSLPDVTDVRNGVIASRIAAHAADIVKGVNGAAERDRQMAIARKKLDWDSQLNLSLDPEHARLTRDRFKTKGKACSMCGDFCAMELAEKHLGVSVSRC
ncbi:MULTISPECIES: phosphomethylpyrimidine synthase ThiC [Dehalococcoides]|uniref:Phosphomethylpyrimidine synthase n=1 Tax=Dehalococcoides mccartyi TaxID=61435 RepID=A0AB38ZAJ9_9CHLR|nr:phosphomethylpyrimidine synthase ThiC [Dehalococcoides mccartyi]OBW61945.1 MAG: phosphomethylpyrimidine synthase [Dehalococcoides mccartyi]WRO07604.1 phosphomethylpyrimidine synthase ThiC [Dehalococcoides mccartyi]